MGFGDEAFGLRGLGFGVYSELRAQGFRVEAVAVVTLGLGDIMPTDTEGSGA